MYKTRSKMCLGSSKNVFGHYETYLGWANKQPEKKKKKNQVICFVMPSIRALGLFIVFLKCYIFLNSFILCPMILIMKVIKETNLQDIYLSTLANLTLIIIYYFQELLKFLKIISSKSKNICKHNSEYTRNILFCWNEFFQN
jgi:hypothetical protein